MAITTISLPITTSPLCCTFSPSELKDKIHTKESESESGSETETESETESESESETETETETESEKDVVPLRKLTDQVVHLGSHTTGIK